MLAHVIKRVQACTSVDRVVVATTTAPADDAVADLASRMGVQVVRGPVDDVLTRYVAAARESCADVVVRITADCPLVDPEVVDTAVRRRAETGADYVSNLTPRTYPNGYDVEVITRSCLERVDQEALTGAEREHVTLRVRDHLQEYRTANIRTPRDLSQLRVTVDYPEDLLQVSNILEALAPNPMPGFTAVSHFLMQGREARGRGSAMRAEVADERVRAVRADVPR
jgi:spore coat polysaccharide biosynthesis protein SpsF (cytidylyltransferase family)